jgi:putative MATE family efflux protein
MPRFYLESRVRMNTSEQPSTAKEARLTRRILTLSLPVILSYQLDNLVGFVDIYYVGLLSTQAISAVGASRAVINIIAIFIVSITTGAFALISQAVGARNMKDASDTARQVILLTGLLGIATGLVGYFLSQDILILLSMPPDVVHLGTRYLQVFFLGAPLLATQFGMSSCFQAAGDTVTPFYVNICVNVVNIVASYILIFGHLGVQPMGVTGAALGTVLARGVGSLLCLILLYSGRSRIAILSGSYRPDRERIRRLLRVGIPAGIEGLFRDGSSVVFLKLVALTQNATAAVAALSIGYQVMRIPLRTSLGLGVTASTLVGQAIGEGDPDKAARRGWTVVAVGAGLLSVLSVNLAWLASDIIAIFTDDAAVIAIGSRYLYVIALQGPMLAIVVCLSGSLRGAGDTKPNLYFTVACQWGVLLPSAWLLAFQFGLDIDGIWLSLLISIVVQSGLIIYTFAGGRWKTRRV